MLDQAAVVSSLLILSLLSFVLNTFCIYIIRQTKSFRSKPSSLLLLNLLSTHLLQAVFVFPLYAAKKMKVKDFYWARIISNGFLFTYLLSFYSVCFGVLNISLDRFLATYLLTKYKKFVNFRNTLIAITISWIYMTLLCLIPFIPRDSVSAAKDATNTSIGLKMGSILNSTITPFLKSSQGKSMNAKRQFYYYTPQSEWTVFMLFCNAAIPLGIIVLCYLYVGIRLNSFSKSYETQSETNTRQTLTSKDGKTKFKEFKKYKQVTIITIILTLTYSIFWSPSIIYYTVLSVCPNKCFPTAWDNSFTEKHIVFIIKYVSFLNALFSPVIYCFRHPRMKEKMYQLKTGVKYRRTSVSMEESARFSIHNIKLGVLSTTSKDSGLNSKVQFS